MITVNPIRCPQNHACPLVRKCPKKAISQKGFSLPVIDHEKCILCTICIRSCPVLYRSVRAYYAVARGVNI